MTHLQQIADHLAEMQLIVMQLMGNDGQRNDVIDNGAKFGYKPNELSGMVQDCNDVEQSLIKQYRLHSQTQFRLLREYEIRNSAPIDFSIKPYPFANGDNGVQPTCNRK
jgi:hypothetical protein